MEHVQIALFSCLQYTSYYYTSSSSPYLLSSQHYQHSSLCPFYVYTILTRRPSFPPITRRQHSLSSSDTTSNTQRGHILPPFAKWSIYAKNTQTTRESVYLTQSSWRFSKLFRIRKPTEIFFLLVFSTTHRSTLLAYIQSSLHVSHTIVNVRRRNLRDKSRPFPLGLNHMPHLHNSIPKPPLWILAIKLIGNTVENTKALGGGRERADE